MRQGAQVWAKPGSRAELQFDDGSTMRLGGGGVAILQNCYSDDHGEFTEVKLTNGLATFHLRSKQSEYQVDTPLASVKANGPTQVRVGVGNTVEVVCKSGSAEVSGQQGVTVLNAKEMLSIHDPSSPFQVASIPSPDQWDGFNSNRDVISEHHNQHVPHNIDLVAGDLDRYGDWHNDPHYGYVWAPRVHDRAWRPYHDGRWVWVSPWGWTWVGREDWGYAPYHYGTWMRQPYGWAWAPGPAVQYWSPAVVDFVDGGVSVGWAPLAPSEVVYPSAINIGFHSGNWWLNFSIGQAACYYPTGPNYCSGRPFQNQFVNQQVNIYNTTNIYNNTGSDNFVRNSRFVPQNSVRYAGMTTASRGAFLGGGRFQAPAADPRGLAFRQGRSFGSGPTHGWQVSGPPTLRPGASSFIPSRAFAKAGGPPEKSLQRSVFRRNVPSAVASHGAFAGATSRPSTHQAIVSRRSGTARAQVMNPANRARNQARTIPPSAGAARTAQRAALPGRNKASGKNAVRSPAARESGRQAQAQAARAANHGSTNSSKSKRSKQVAAQPARTASHGPARSPKANHVTAQPVRAAAHGSTKSPGVNRQSQVRTSPKRRQNQPATRTAPVRQRNAQQAPSKRSANNNSQRAAPARQTRQPAQRTPGKGQQPQRSDPKKKDKGTGPDNRHNG